ncbi:2OG-Fe(II) oxygenase superfamily [Verticillium alfalfae VaMs.102]|uniref:2OG-Fe(II) oxygenase superfamily n=1 Tax=Verticillium alfalfae (strain VaMs.102 / ATCC MYA-4576 / FGSC 10136) TaxID=526221 RepID=C9SCP2_VERA1|nr:2OG-Fe(II) oxygenase superfamily [Verticillium alfalfae VaMs.102]EEY16857.1 2OG-Fe(II) oxygenase superfamily [Verticillium alfalfae VaMs.102]
MEGEFTEVPVLDYSLSQHPTGKAEFLSQLRNAIVNVGFFYLSNHSIPEEVQRAVLEQTNAFFSLPLQKKMDIDMAHSKHFLGYNRMNSEKTVAITGQNESVFFGPDYPPPNPAALAYLNLHGPSQWPDQNAVPDFHQAVETYRCAVQDLATSFISLTSEALGLETNSFSWLFKDAPFSRLNLRMYPAPLEESNRGARYGIAPHKDSSFMTYLLQGGDHNCLEVQSKTGNWIAVPPIPGTLVVNIGRLLEILTRGVCIATTHRVILGSTGFLDKHGNRLGSRLSIPFFQNVNLRLMPDDFAVDVPAHVVDLSRGERIVADSGTFFSGIFDDSVGDTVFVSMLTSFVETAKVWYPDLLPVALKKQAEKKRLDIARGAKIE